MTSREAVAYARALYEALPKGNFNSATFEELGRSSYLGKAWGQLSVDLRSSVIRLAVAFYDTCQKMDDEGATPAPTLENMGRSARVAQDAEIEAAAQESEGDASDSPDDDIDARADSLLSTPAEPPVTTVQVEVVQGELMDDGGA